MEEPQRRIGGVIQAFAIAFRKHVRDQPVAHIMCESTQDPFTFRDAPGCEGQTFERDHRVAAPIGEPVIPGDDGAHLVTLGVRPDDIGDPADRRDDETVGGEDQLGREPLARGRGRHRDEAPPPLGLKAARRVRVQCFDGVPRLGRGDQRRHAIRLQLNGEVARAPERTARVIAALFLGHEVALMARSAIRRERRCITTGYHQAQHRQPRAGGNLVVPAVRGQRVARRQRLADRGLDAAEIDRGAQE